HDLPRPAQDLERDREARGLVLGAIDGAHRARARLQLDREAIREEVVGAEHAESPHHRVREVFHPATSSTARASLRNSSSLAVTERRVSSTIRRSSRRAYERRLVTSVTEIPSWWAISA